MLRTLVAVVLLSVSVSAQSPAVDDLRRCLADNTTGKDRKELARWIFLAMAAHPDMKVHTAADTAAAADASAKTMAALITRLLTDTCVQETRTIVKAGDPRAAQLAFESLGQLAMQELMVDGAVAQAMNSFMKYVDAEKFNAAIQQK